MNEIAKKTLAIAIETFCSTYKTEFKELIALYIFEVDIL